MRAIGEIKFPCKENYDLFRRAIPSMVPKCIMRDASHYDADHFEDKPDSDDANEWENRGALTMMKFPLRYLRTGRMHWKRQMMKVMAATISKMPLVVGISTTDTIIGSFSSHCTAHKSRRQFH